MIPIPPPILKNWILYFDFSSRHQRRNFFDRGREWLRFRDLRTDVHLHAANGDSRHFARALINLCGAGERNPEFVLTLAGGDVGVRLRGDIGIYPQRNRRAWLFADAISLM
jgi:hypothetical protein